MINRWLVILVTASAWLAPAAAHQVSFSQFSINATVLSLSYADGTPFANQAYELYAAGDVRPVQVGRSDSQGRIAFVPERAGKWRLKVVSPDGHGVDMRFFAAPGDSSAVPNVAPGFEPALAAVTGLGVLFGLFGVYQLFLRRRRHAR